MTRSYEHGLTPKEKVNAARQRFLEAVSDLKKPGGQVFGSHRKESIAFVGLALLAGFVMGYSPRIRRICMTTVVDFVWDFVRRH